MRIERVIRQRKEFAVLPMNRLIKLMQDAEMLADIKAYDRAKKLSPAAKTKSYRLRSSSAASPVKARLRFGVNIED